MSAEHDEKFVESEQPHLLRRFGLLESIALNMTNMLGIGPFITIPLLLSALGGIGGALLGSAVTAGYSSYQGWMTVIPLWALTGGVAATFVIGGLAGLYPAIRASKLSPTEALATP